MKLSCVFWNDHLLQWWIENLSKELFNEKKKNHLSSSSSDDQIPILWSLNFNDDSTTHLVKTFNGASFKTANNSKILEKNSPTRPFGVLTNSGKKWEGVYIDLYPPIRLKNGRTIKLNAYSESSVPILLKLESVTNDVVPSEISAEPRKTSSWAGINCSFFCLSDPRSCYFWYHFFLFFLWWREQILKDQQSYAGSFFLLLLESLSFLSFQNR